MHVSLVVPACNVAPWIGEAIGSVLAQSHPSWMLYVVDDGSTDETVAIARGFDDTRIRIIRQPNQGVSIARNRGLALARGEAVLFLDADDVLAPDALARMTRRLAARPRAVAVAGGFAFFPERLARAGVPPRAFSRMPRGDLLPQLLERNPFANGGHVLVRREAAERAGGFPPGLAYGEDWAFWTHIARFGPFAALRRGAPVLAVRQRAGSAYFRLARDPASFRPCMEAIFGDPYLAARFGAAGVARLRARAEAENAWIVGRELIRHGRTAEGRGWLRRSVAAKPTLRRAVLLGAAHALALLPEAAHGPFRTYPASG